MATRYVTVAQARATSGITTKFISDSDMEQLISSAEYEIERMTNTCFTPTTVIEQYEGNGTERQVLTRNPVTKLRALTIDDTTVTPEYCRIDKQGGILWLTTSAEQISFKAKATERNLVRIKYDYCMLQPTTTQTVTTAATVAGDAVSVSVSSSTGITADTYVEIQGMDSMQETAKVSSVTNPTTIVVDNLALPHESGSMVTLQQVPPVGQRMMEVGAALMAVARVVGQSFDEITGYSIGDEHVQKGEPYTQWRETSTQLRKEWNDIWKAWRVRPSVQ